MWIARDLEHQWGTASRQPVRILTGPRQCGKSSLLEHLGREHFQFVSLDDLQNRTLAQSDPALFFQVHPGDLVIDEVHLAPQLFSEIKRMVDAQKAGKMRARQFWLSGSNQMLFRKGMEESLAGRASPLRLHPLSVAEISAALPEFSLSNLFLFGGWPELLAHHYTADEALRYLNEYLHLVLEKDVVQSAGIQKVPQFLKVVTLLAGRAANVLELSSLGSAAGVQTSTISDWVSSLEQMQVLSRLPCFHTDLTQRMIKAPKVFFQDCGVLCRLQGWPTLQPLLTSPMVGAAFENLVFTEILKTRDHHLKLWELSYFRTKDGEEIDFVVSSGQRRVLLESKFAVQNARALTPSPLARKVLGEETPIHLVTFGGDQRLLSGKSYQVPLQNLRDFLLDQLP